MAFSRSKMLGGVDGGPFCAAQNGAAKTPAKSAIAMNPRYFRLESMQDVSMGFLRPFPRVCV
jgi:hypothetical protein